MKFAPLAALALAAACGANSLSDVCSSDADCSDAQVCIESTCQDAALRRSSAIQAMPETASRNVPAGVKPQNGWFTIFDRSWQGHDFAIGCNAGAKPTPASGHLSILSSQKVTVDLQPPPSGTSRVTCQVTSPSGLTVYDSFRLTLHATGGGNNGDFSVAASPAALALDPGASGASTVSVKPSNGFASDVALSVTGLPSGASAAFDSATVAGGSGSATLTVQAGTAEPGQYALTVSATGGGLSHDAPLQLTVNQPAPAADFSVSASPGSLSLASGGSGSSTIAIAPQGNFSGDVALSVSGVPQGASASFDNATVPGGSGSAVLTVNAGTAGASSATLTVTAVSGALSHSATIALSIAAAGPPPDFSVAASPGSISLTQGGAAGGSTVTVAPSNGFASDVALSVSGAPSGVKLSFDRSSIAGGSGSASLSVAASSTAPVGSYALTVTAAGGSLSHTATIELTISAPAPAPDFFVAASPSSISIATGGAAGQSTLTVTPQNGFARDVSLSVSGAPSGTSASFSASTVTGGSGTSTLSVQSSSAAAGSYTLTVTASGGGVAHSTTIALSISPAANFALSASPGQVSVTSGQSATAVVTATPSNGFGSAISLSASGLPSGASASFSPSALATGSGSSTLTLSTSSSVAAGTYTITLTGSGGGLTRTASVSLTVTAPVCTTDTWNSWAHSFFTSNCTGCHSNFGSYSGVSSDQSNIQQQISSGNMPLGSSLSSSDKSRILKWLGCGLPQ